MSQVTLCMRNHVRVKGQPCKPCGSLRTLDHYYRHKGARMTPRQLHTYAAIRRRILEVRVAKRNEANNGEWAWMKTAPIEMLQARMRFIVARLAELEKPR